MKRVIVIAAVLLAVSNAFGTELWVPSQYSTIQSAIDAASDGDTIIVLPGTYDGNLQWDVNNLTLTSVNPEDPCVIDVTVLFGRIQFDPAVNGGLLTGVTITGGNPGVLGNNGATATISNCVIRNNSTGVAGWSGTISDCLFFGNNRAVMPSSSPLSLINCTIANNDFGVQGVNSSLLVINCVIWGNYQQQVSSGNPPATIQHSCVQGGAFGEDNIEDDPLFMDPVHGDFRLQAGSPCIDAGRNTSPVFMQFYDLGGNFRQIDGDGDGVAVIDMGAYEYGSATGPIVSVWPEEILFIGLNESVPSPQKFYISNIGPGLLNWSTTEDCPWLSVTPLSGYSTEVTVTADITGIGSGLNTYNLVVRDSAGNSQAVVRVDCVILDSANLNVPAQYPTIQSAIDAAVSGDTVVVAPGRYTGPGNTGLDLYGRPITVRSLDPNDPWVVNNTVIDCNRQGAGFVFQTAPLPGPNAVVEGFTITNGSGGGIRITYGSPVIRNCVITNSIAPYSPSAGGIFCSGTNSSPSIINCDITNNYAQMDGGGMNISSSGSPSIIGCRIAGNLSGSRGGGIVCTGSTTTKITIIDSNIVSNKSNSSGGGGIYTGAGSVKITRTLIAGNIASGTSSPNGGGIYVMSGTMEINNSVVAGNFAQANGGGVYKNTSAGVIMSNCTFAGNAATSLGGGVYLPSSSLSAVHTIFWGNKDSTGVTTYAQISPLPPTPGQMLLFSCIQDFENIFGGANNGNINDDPMFVREPNDGGDGWGVGDNDDYGDLHLKPGSPCIDKGNPLYVPGPNVTDIDGEPRVIGRAVDIGADEYDKIITVTMPVADEVWATGSKHPIKWDKYGVGSVNVLFSSDDGSNWETIAEGIMDANSYLWQLPGDVDSNQCVISVVPSVADVNVINMTSGLFTVSWYPTRPAVPSQWLRRGLLPAPNLSENKGPRIGCTKWVFETDGPVSSQVAVTRPYWDSYWIYIGAEDGNIYALDDLGELNWIYDINTAVVGSPAVGYYWMVYVAGQNGWLYAIDDYGYLCWTHKTDAPIYSTPVVGYDGKIYVCSEDGFIYALDADGSELWTFATKGPANLSGTIFATPVIDKNGTVYIGGLYEPNLYALDANNGSVKWVCNFGAVEPNKGQIVASPAIGPNGTIYQTLVRDPNLYAVDPCTGNILWSTRLRPDPDYYCTLGNEQCCSRINQYLTALRNHTTISPTLLQQYQNCDEGRWQGIAATGWVNYTSSSGWSSPVVGSDGTIYVSFDDPYLRAVEPNGTIKWVTRLGLIGGFTLSLDRDGLIYAASDDNFVCVVDSNGRELSRFEGNDWVSFPAIAEDGTLIVSDANNRVWAITSNSCDGQSPVLHTPADLRANKMVDFIDFAVLAESWRDCTDPFDATYCAAGITKYGLYAPGDVDRDAYINLWDLNALVDEWLTQSEFE